MITYTYTNITNKPNLSTWELQSGSENPILVSGIHYDTINSEMSDKSLEGCFWDEDFSILKIYFDQTLSEADETILDNIVSENL